MVTFWVLLLVPTTTWPKSRLVGDAEAVGAAAAVGTTPCGSAIAAATMKGRTPLSLDGAEAACVPAGAADAAIGARANAMVAASRETGNDTLGLRIGPPSILMGRSWRCVRK